MCLFFSISFRISHLLPPNLLLLLLQHFFHRTIRDCAARMGLKVDFKWLLLMSENVKDISLILMDGSAVTLIGLQSVQVYSIPCPLQAPCSEGESDLRLAVPVSSKGFRHPCSAVQTGSSSNEWSVLTPIDRVTLCFPGVCCRPCRPKVVPFSFFLTMNPLPVLLV